MRINHATEQGNKPLVGDVDAVLLCWYGSIARGTNGLQTTCMQTCRTIMFRWPQLQSCSNSSVREMQAFTLNLSIFPYNYVSTLKCIQFHV